MSVFNDPALDAMLKKANADFEMLSPEEKTAHRREQYISFVYGQLRLSGRDITKEQVAAVYDDMLARGELRST
jgi:hypothetical protein